MANSSIFDIITPIMVGPSSSHTAGAVRIGLLAGKIFGSNRPQKVHFKLYNSFAKTGKGHGTDKGLLSGVLGFNVDDTRIKNALDIAKELGVKYSFEYAEDYNRHPNSVDIIFYGREEDDDAQIRVSADSLGGAKVVITNINGYQVNLRGDYHTLLLIYKDKPGMIYRVTTLIQDFDINIASMTCDREAKGHNASMSICLDSPLTEDIINSIKTISEIYLIRNIEVTK